MSVKVAHLEFPGDSGLYETIHYPAGESQVRLTAEGLSLLKDATFVELTANLKGAQDLVEFHLLVNAIRGLYRQLHVHFPYLPYGRADRRFCDGDCSGLLTFLQMLPQGVGLTYSTLDAHNPAVLPDWMVNISAKPLILQAINRHARGADGLTVIFPDEGALARYELPKVLESQGGRFTIQCLAATKKRDPRTGKLSGFEAPAEAIKHDRVLVVDDICDGGGTFIGVAQALRIAKERLGLYVTHGIFSKGLDELLKFFQVFYVSSSWPSQYPELVELGGKERCKQ